MLTLVPGQRTSNSRSEKAILGAPGYSRSSSRNSETDSRNAKLHSRNGISRLEQYENHNSRSNSWSHSHNGWEWLHRFSFDPAAAGMFRRSASLAIPHLKSFATIPSVSLVQLGHTNRSVFLSHVKLPSFRHFQDQFLTTNKEKCGKKNGPVFAMFAFLTFRGPLASHDSNPYPNRSRIARYNATNPVLPFLVFFGIPCFFPCKDFLVF